jgi:hypothetical protein
MPPRLELAEPGRFLQQGPALRRLRREDLLHPPLSDHGTVPAAESDVGQQLDEVGTPHRRFVDQVLALAASVQAAGDRDLAEFEGLERAVGVVEQQLDLAPVCRRAAGGAGKEDVVGPLGAELRGRERPGGPEQCVGDVGLARPVWADDDRDPPLEPHIDRIRERLEAAQLDRAQVHAFGTLTSRADDAQAS